jgi:hypothetical protein
MCVFITAGPSTKMFTWGGVCVYCVLLQDLVHVCVQRTRVCVGVFYYCRTYYKAVRVCVYYCSTEYKAGCEEQSF